MHRYVLQPPSLSHLLFIHAKQHSSNASQHSVQSGKLHCSQKEPVPIPQHRQSGRICIDPSTRCSDIWRLCSARHHKAYAAAREGLRTRASHGSMLTCASRAAAALSRSTHSGVPSRPSVSSSPRPAFDSMASSGSLGKSSWPQRASAIARRFSSLILPPAARKNDDRVGAKHNLNLSLKDAERTNLERFTIVRSRTPYMELRENEVFSSLLRICERKRCVASGKEMVRGYGFWLFIS